MTTRRLTLGALVLAAAIGAVATVAAQRGGGGSGFNSQQSYTGNVRYDGRFTFVRMSYPYGGRQRAPWSHDYRDGEYNFLKILQAITNVPAHIDESSIMSFSDPELMKFPVAYLCEPGYWYLSETDVVNLRAYLQKGGFMIVDDFPLRSQGNVDSWAVFDQQMSRVFPEGRWVKLTASNPIFHSFFDVNSVENIPTAYPLGSQPEFWALFEDNDTSKRIMVIANYMNDLSEFWESSSTGYYVVADVNEAFKFGVNEFLYGITH